MSAQVQQHHQAAQRDQRYSQHTKERQLGERARYVCGCKWP
ncbi:hypothetical protein [Streptomyces sp. NPDC007100]